MATYAMEHDVSFAATSGPLAGPDLSYEPPISPQQPRYQRPTNNPSYPRPLQESPRLGTLEEEPQLRGSRLPVFQQVRSMLQTRRPSPRTGSPPKWDPYSGELSEHGKVSSVRPSNYQPPVRYEARRRSLDRRTPSMAKSVRSSRSISPVSTLRASEYDYEFRPSIDTTYDYRPVSPVSPVSSYSGRRGRARSDVPPLPVPKVVVQEAPLPETPVSLKVPKRKPVSSNNTPSPIISKPARSSSPDDVPKVDAREAEDAYGDTIDTPVQPTSHFSWSSYAPSFASSIRHTMDASDAPGSPMPSIDEEPESRFSWSTAATSAKHPSQRLDSPPPSPPPPVPEKYMQPPIQSILSRQRPIPRAEPAELIDHEEASSTVPIPPPRSKLRPVRSDLSGASRSTSPEESKRPRTSTSEAEVERAGLAIVTDFRPRTTATSPATAASTPAGSKRLPPPPTPSSSSPLSHLDSLIRAENDMVHQRKNMERVIASLTSLAAASPLDVSFDQVRDAKRKLEELRITLDEVKLEERDIGIAISRARRKIGEDEGLWVRRVTG